MCNLLGTVTLAAALALAGNALAQDTNSKPMIVLVHGAFAESSSRNGVIKYLERDGYDVIAAANPLSSVAGDAAVVSTLIRSLQRPVVLVGHSYGGPVITEAAKGMANVKALVYVAAFAPDIGESTLTLSARFPGSTLGAALTSIQRPDGVAGSLYSP
jgi:pimeloyl-ACP methyl ester carboxylesterase